MIEHIDLIGKKLSNSLSDSEKELFEALMQDADFQKHFDKYEKIWNGSRESLSVMNSKSALNKVLSKIQAENNDHVISNDFKAKQIDWNWIIKIAASLFIIISISFSTYWYLSNSNSEDTSAIHIVQIIKENPKGQKSTIFLPDGSKVILNSESKITYPSAFHGESREVVLDGEAFFDVVPDKNLPFIVATNAVNIRVLGTSFNVYAHNNSNTHKVSLATGAIEVTQQKTEAGDKVLLSPGQAISYNMGDQVFSDIRNFNPKAEYGWKDGLIYFENATFKEVIQTLEVWYGVDFTIDGQLNSEWHYSGAFDNYTLNNVLYALSFTGKFNYEIEGKKVRVNF